MTITLANSSSEYDWRSRPETDFYPTPPEVTTALLRFVGFSEPRTIWEPAAGQGHMSSVLKAHGHNVIESDIQTGTDFLAADRVECDWIITNPPFISSEQFICRCVEMNPREGFALLLKSQYWHSARRLKTFLEITPRYVLPLTWRPDFLFGKKSGSPTMEVLWCVWQMGHDRVHPQYIPLPRPR